MRVPKDSPRYKAAERRAQSARDSKTGIGDAMEQNTRENKIRAIVAKPLQPSSNIRHENDPSAVALTQEALRKRKAALK